eukprot:11207040-Lingulodinium_polyedra.AAC.1
MPSRPDGGGAPRAARPAAPTPPGQRRPGAAATSPLGAVSAPSRRGGRPAGQPPCATPRPRAPRGRRPRPQRAAKPG